ncbi:deoxynucleoside triphosphate triphosphohydrolase SAMHD1-like isoform X2 [Actinia tenebrosa]|uniref:Deoxynucleoside triphosphate triphosphohydrolase SAMHD1-like isoform X2 n=1 Tax=Actinia tenebrosa TaxID=6105 RepID=A0A6P8I3B2_ACTTE|nr:deoxynucleoside triphosphate triphosphohydrolase SAMHD1-like isoform X2 [Actinia tenebrosa]
MVDGPKAKIFNDPVHGHIEMPELCVKIIDTPQFQRLRYIKQLGGCYFVYPGAAHNRFEHSIGTAHLAGLLVESLKSRQEDLGITDEDVLCVKIAGLCHDLGHGPFSHLFDASFVRKFVDENWKHEKASLAMVDLIFENLKGKDPENFKLKEKDVFFIKELINGPTEGSKEDWPYKGREKEKGFLYQIISNKESGIDVDKWDYFARDCYHLGMKSTFDHMRCIKMARAIRVEEDNNKWHICFRDKEVHNIYEMFHVRSILHRRAYQHKTSNAVELMITDALVKADPYLLFEGKGGNKLKMSEAIHDMVAYTKITDRVYHQILLASDPQLQEAKQILERIECRELYRSIREHTTEEDISCKDVDKADFLEKAKMSEVKKEDIILDVSYMLPKAFLEWKIRLYLRKTELDENKTKQLIEGFGDWVKLKERAASSSGAAGREDETPEKKPEAHDGAPSNP